MFAIYVKRCVGVCLATLCLLYSSLGWAARTASVHEAIQRGQWKQWALLIGELETSYRKKKRQKGTSWAYNTRLSLDFSRYLFHMLDAARFQSTKQPEQGTLSRQLEATKRALGSLKFFIRGFAQLMDEAKQKNALSMQLLTREESRLRERVQDLRTALLTAKKTTSKPNPKTSKALKKKLLIIARLMEKRELRYQQLAKESLHKEQFMGVLWKFGVGVTIMGGIGTLLSAAALSDADARKEQMSVVERQHQTDLGTLGAYRYTPVLALGVIAIAWGVLGKPSTKELVKPVFLSFDRFLTAFYMRKEEDSLLSSRHGRNIQGVQLSKVTFGMW